MKSDKKVIALTFDDGPNMSTTVRILDLLEEYRIKASFFVVGKKINDRTADVIKRARSLSCEINSHSFTHSDMTKFSEEQIRAEMDATAELIEKAAGEPPKFFRPPYIAVDPLMHKVIDLPFIAGIGCNDWDNSVSSAERVRSVTGNCGDGSIILLHDSAGNGKTVTALKKIIPFFLGKGFGFVTVSELFRAKGVTPSADGETIYSVL